MCALIRPERCFVARADQIMNQSRTEVRAVTDASSHSPDEGFHTLGHAVRPVIELRNEMARMPLKVTCSKGCGTRARGKTEDLTEVYNPLVALPTPGGPPLSAPRSVEEVLL